MFPITTALGIFFMACAKASSGDENERNIFKPDGSDKEETSSSSSDSTYISDDSTDDEDAYVYQAEPLSKKKKQLVVLADRGYRDDDRNSKLIDQFGDDFNQIEAHLKGPPSATDRHLDELSTIAMQHGLERLAESGHYYLVEGDIPTRFRQFNSEPINGFFAGMLMYGCMDPNENWNSFVQLQMEVTPFMAEKACNDQKAAQARAEEAARAQERAQRQREADDVRWRARENYMGRRGREARTQRRPAPIPRDDIRDIPGDDQIAILFYRWTNGRPMTDVNRADINRIYTDLNATPDKMDGIVQNYVLRGPDFHRVEFE